MTACDPRVSGNSFHDDHCYLAKKGYNADIAGDLRLPTSVLFQKLYNNGYKRVTTQFYDDLCYIMARMHLHSVFSTDDLFHTTVKQVLEKVVTQEDKIQR